MRVRESTIEQELIEKLGELKYSVRPDIRDRAAMEQNFREKFEALNRVTLTDAECQRLLGEIVDADVFKATHTLRHKNTSTRDDGIPLNHTLVNVNDWCKNTFEVVSQFRVPTNNNYHHYQNLNKQQRIPDYLSSLDAHIIFESKQLAALKAHKQGLMQPLFPSAEVGA